MDEWFGKRMTFEKGTGQTKKQRYTRRDMPAGDYDARLIEWAIEPKAKFDEGPEVVTKWAIIDHERYEGVWVWNHIAVHAPWKRLPSGTKVPSGGAQLESLMFALGYELLEHELQDKERIEDCLEDAKKAKRPVRGYWSGKGWYPKMRIEPTKRPAAPSGKETHDDIPF